MLGHLISFGVITGTVISLGAIGMSLLFGVTRFVNFAYGEWLALSAFLTYLFNVTFGFHLLISAVLALILMSLIGPLLNEWVFEPLSSEGRFTLLIASIGLSFVMQHVIIAVWGTDVRQLAVPQGLNQPHFLGPFILTNSQIMMLIISLVVMMIVHLLLTRSKLGKAMRAVSNNPVLAGVSGINRRYVIRMTWVIASVLAALSGVMLALATQVTPTMGFNFLFTIVAAVILGGVGNPYGAVIGAMIIGLVMEVGAGYTNPSFKLGLAFGVLVLTLLIKPRGLLGEE